MTDSTASATPKSGEITVSGSGRVSVQPDVAELRLGVSVSRASVGEARQEAATVMGRILGAIDAAGVAKRDVTTSLLAVQPRYDYRDGQTPKLVGYELSNVVAVTIRDLDRLDEVVDGSLNAGATSMDGLEFRLADPVPAEQEARRRAMADARSHADVFAEAAGLTISGVRSVAENGSFQPPRPLAKAERMMMAADAATPVESGSLEVSVGVTVTYQATG